MNINNPPFVSVIVPCRNEFGFIERTLENIIGQDYPGGRIEILVADGMSNDGTRDILEKYASRYPNLKVIDNLDLVVSHGLNKCIQKSKGEIICRMDAHCEYPGDYISRLVQKLILLSADNVGGLWITFPGDRTSTAKAIALATAHPFGVGNAWYRIGGTETREVDTVPFGCYRREVFDRIGLFDEQLLRNQDDEFNGRLKKSGGKIFLIPEVEIRYYARESLIKIANMFYQYGLFKPLVNIRLKYPGTVRQLIPPLFVVALAALLMSSLIFYRGQILLLAVSGIYLFSDLMFAAIITTRNKSSFSVFLSMLMVFPVIHISYGLGYLYGIFKFVIFRQHNDIKGDSIKMTR